MNISENNNQELVGSVVVFVEGQSPCSFFTLFVFERERER
jgi:hypothetical protein